MLTFPSIAANRWGLADFHFHVDFIVTFSVSVALPCHP
jgi:hypothetical protein